MEFTLEKVRAIPASSWNKRLKGESMYNELIDGLKDLPLNEPQLIRHPVFKPHRIYNALWLILKNRKIKNIRLAMRNKKVYAEKIFE